jgi:hypothetical protein
MKKTACIFLLAVLVTNAGASPDPFAGKWELNVAESRYPAGACPESMTIKMEAVGDGVRYTSDAVFANGNTVHSEYTAEYNGKQAIAIGAHGMMLPVFLKRIDSSTVIASYTKGLVVVATSRRVISDDGRRMTITTISKDAAGENVTTIGIFEKQK